MLKHFFFYEKQYDFLALRHLAVCTKIFFFLFFNFFVFLEVLMTIGYFNIGFVFLRCKILPDINQNDIKTTRKIIKC